MFHTVKPKDNESSSRQSYGVAFPVISGWGSEHALQSNDQKYLSESRSWREKRMLGIGCAVTQLSRVLKLGAGSS